MVKIDGKLHKVVGIVVECNPFHKGHIRLLEECKNKGDFIVAIMSGNYVQRGEASVYDKYKRANELLKHGVSLIIELPIEYVLSSAKFFAGASVQILNNLGFIDYLIFGSKINDIDELNRIAAINIDEDSDKLNNSIGTIKNNGNNIKSKIKCLLKEGKSYAASISKIISENTDKKLTPNDILAVEYIRAINMTGSKIEPLTIKRKNDLPTASALREKIKKKITCDSFSDILNYKLLLAKNSKELNGCSNLSSIYLMTEDMENAILNSISLNNNISFTKRAMALKTKNLTLAYIKRLFFNIIFNIKKVDVAPIYEEVKGTKSKGSINNGIKKFKKNNYIRILGFNKICSSLLKKIRIPMLMSFAPSSYKDFISKYKKPSVIKNKKGEYILSPILRKNIFASDLYYHLSDEKFCESKRQIVTISL